MADINYVIGDATIPCGDGTKFIAHVCNNRGGWGRGFVVALSKRDREPELCYRQWYENGSYPEVEGREVPFELGQIMLTEYDPLVVGVDDVFVVNMIAQNGIRHDPSAPPAIDYKALRQCLDQMGQHAANWSLVQPYPVTIHMPRIGCGLGGGDWAIVEEAILASLVDVYGLDVTVYDLPSKG